MTSQILTRYFGWCSTVPGEQHRLWGWEATCWAAGWRSPAPSSNYNNHFWHESTRKARRFHKILLVKRSTFFQMISISNECLNWHLVVVLPPQRGRRCRPEVRFRSQARQLWRGVPGDHHLLSNFNLKVFFNFKKYLWFEKCDFNCNRNFCGWTPKQFVLNEIFLAEKLISNLPFPYVFTVDQKVTSLFVAWFPSDRPTI